jgi:altronate dehydratase large subunit
VVDICNPVSPTIKITGNPRTAVHFADNIDLDLSGVTTGTLTLPQAAAKLWETLLAVANGQCTKGEVLGTTEVAISRIGFSL